MLPELMTHCRRTGITRSRPLFRRAGRLAGAAVLLLFWMASLASCDKKEEEKTDEQEVKPLDLPLLDPISSRRGAGNCKVDPGKEQILRARDGAVGEGATIEVGDGVLLAGGRAVVGLRSSDQTKAFVAIATDAGVSTEVDLGRLFGGTDLPVMIAAGPSLLVALSDNEATSRRLRLVRIDSPLSGPKVTWGPSFSLTRDESFAISLAGNASRAMVAWDDYDKTAERSRVVAVVLDPSDFSVVAPPRVISKMAIDAVEPQIALFGKLFAVSYVPLTVVNNQAEKDALVEEPERALSLLLLDDSGKQAQEPLSISAPQEHVLAYDFAAGKNSLWFGYRSSRVGNRQDGEQIELASVGPDGAIRRETLTHDRLGPGAPLVFESSGKDPVVVTRGEDAELLSVDLAEGTDLQLQPELEEAIPLDFSKQRLLYMRPSGLDWIVQTASCAPSTGDPKAPQAPKKSSDKN